VSETTEAVALKLKVTEALGKDLGLGLARIDPADMARLGIEIGDIVEVVGKRTTVAKAMPTYKEWRGQSRVQIDGLGRENARTGIDQVVEVRKASARPARTVVLAPVDITPSARDLKYIGSLLDGLAVIDGDRIRATLFGTRSADFKVTGTTPGGPVLIHPTTALEIRGTGGKGEKGDKDGGRTFSYEDVGGLKREIARIREIVELPLRYPEVFERLGIDPPKGVLLHGPPGCGKTLIARAVAHETDATFFCVNGPEIIHKFYGESEANLRKIFEEAAAKAPSIIFLDEIDCIAPRREKVVGDVEKRVVAQLLALMDGLSQRKNVVVIAATNIPNVLDPALRRPGRFDREIAIPIPDRSGRRGILEIHTRGMPLAEDVDLDHVAEITHGFVGADLEALCREAAMSALRRIMPQIDFATAEIPYEAIMKLTVHPRDFQEALREVEPSAIREVFVEVPETSWDDVGGLDEIKAALVEAVEWPIVHRDLFEQASVRPPRGILLSGPPGCGKTLLAKAIASITQVNFISVKGPQLLAMYVGESERAVREVFQKAKQAAPCILFFDEIDALVPTRGSGAADSHVTERVISQFLTEVDGVEELNGVLILGATNRPDILDPALLRPGRFDLVLKVPPPDLAGRRKIFEIGLRGKPVTGDICIEELAAASDGLTGADVQAVCKRAALDALRDVVVQNAAATAREAAGAAARKDSAAGASNEDGGKTRRSAPQKSAKVLVTRAHIERALAAVREASGTTGGRR